MGASQWPSELRLNDGVSAILESCVSKSEVGDRDGERCCSFDRISLSIRLYISTQFILNLYSLLLFVSERDMIAEFKLAITKKERNPENAYLMEERIRRKVYNELAFFLIGSSSILKQHLRAYKCESYFK